MNREKVLSEGLAAMHISLQQKQQQQLLDYLDLLQKWNKAFNLSGVREETLMVSRHLLDSLTLHSFIADRSKEKVDQRLRVIDVGTGPGLPGIPLAICFPDVDFVLLDSNGKKTRFVFQAKVALQLTNVSVENCRVEHYQRPAQIDIVLSRAFSSLAEMATKTAHLQSPESAEPLRWLAMKGVYPAAEITQLPAAVAVERVLRVQVPGDSGERHIVEMVNKSDKPNGLSMNS